MTEDEFTDLYSIIAQHLPEEEEMGDFLILYKDWRASGLTHEEAIRRLRAEIREFNNKNAI